MPMVKTFRTIEQSDNWSIIFFQSVLFSSLLNSIKWPVINFYKNICFIIFALLK